METRAHRQLKHHAVAFLRNEGFLAIAQEVRCPGSRYRADVAGWLDRLPFPTSNTNDGSMTLWSTITGPRRKYGRPTCQPRTVIIECKQSRADFIRDDRKAHELITLRDELRAWQSHIEEHRIKPQEPELQRTGSNLFPELEEWDFNNSRIQAYRRLLNRTRRIEKQLYGETKFSLMARYQLADQLYIAAPTGLLRKREVPAGWGLLEFPRNLLRQDNHRPNPAAPDPPNRQHQQHPIQTSPNTARITIQPPPHSPSKPDHRQHLLRNIAIANTRDAMKPNPTPMPSPSSAPSPSPTGRGPG